MILLFQCESSHACQSLAPLVQLKRKKQNSFKIIISFVFTSPLFLATKVAISFLYYTPKTIKCTQKPKIEKKFYRNRPIEPASECHSPHHIYNLLLRMHAIHELKRSKTLSCYGWEAWLLKKIQNGGVCRRILSKQPREVRVGFGSVLLACMVSNKICTVSVKTCQEKRISLDYSRLC